MADVQPNEEDLVLTTVDNPYSPKTEYELWKRYDTDNGYNTEEYLARLIDIDEHVDIDDELTLSALTNAAIQEILEQDKQEIYKLV